MSGRIAFWVLASLIVGGALFTITRRNIVSAVISLVATFFALAALYTLLAAHFIAVIQVLIYAGAIMTLFVFVIMLIGRDEASPIGKRGLPGRILGIAAGAYLLLFLGQRFFSLKAIDPTLPPEGWGGVASVGEALFADYLFPFEAISLLLLVAVIGAVVIARLRAAENPVDEDAATPAGSHDGPPASTPGALT